MEPPGVGCYRTRVWRGEFVDLFQDLHEGLFFSLSKRVSGVAIRTPQVTGGETDEHARQAGKSAFALQAQVDFIDD